MKSIVLTQGRTTIVDDDDYEELKKFNWCLLKTRNTLYAAKGSKINRLILMHRVITKAKKGLVVDHLNGDGLDNRKSNLRVVTHQQNIFNRTKLNKNNKSGERGIYWDKSRERWTVRVNVKGKVITKRFIEKKDAIEKRNSLVILF